MDILSLISLFFIVLSLVWMGWIDLKLWILPNELMILFFVFVCVFHVTSNHFEWLFYGIGGVLGGGSLWLIRTIANRIYGFETLGFGDVKLLTVGGFWLGPEAILMALSLGAFMGVVHAICIYGYRKFIKGHNISLNRMALPAGPGFIFGILIIKLLENFT
jgi:leader peptidase (prepilin peptidase)/N-methyltransferase